MTTRPLGAQIAHALQARGITTIFGIPGVHNVEMYRGIEEAGLTHILARHEQGAGFMADGYARATGGPGVCFLISGPGLTNALTPLGQAYADSVPVLAISSCLDVADIGLGQGRLHEMRDQEGAAETVCAWSKTAYDARGAWRLIDRAFAGFASQRPRPVHVQVPIDVLGAAAEAAPDRPQAPERSVAGPEVVTRAAQMVRKANKPLVIVGGGAGRAAEPVRALVDRIGAAVLPTYAGRGVVPASWPLHLGANTARRGIAGWIAEADLLIVLGSEMSETDFWGAPPPVTCPAIRVDLDPEVLADHRASDLKVLSDVGAFARALAEAVPKGPSGWDAGRIAAARSAFRAEIDAQRPGILPLVEAMMEACPDDTTFVSDMTQFAYAAKELCPMDEPGRWLHPYGFGTLGYALPASIGAKVGLGPQPVCAIIGDYGFHYTMAELGVAVELGLSLPIILWDNGKLKEIEDSMIRSQIAPNAVIARNPDFVALAKAFGAGGVEATSVEGFKAALRAAFAADGPTLIRVTPQTATA